MLSHRKPESCMIQSNLYQVCFFKKLNKGINSRDTTCGFYFYREEELNQSHKVWMEENFDNFLDKQCM